MISKITILSSSLFLLTIFYHRTIDAADVHRMPVARSRANQLKDAGCTISRQNYANCHIMSRSFGQISVKKSSAQESLVNEADTCFMGIVYIGSPPQKFFIDFDTGSSDLWIPSSRCTSDCNKFNKYSSNDSTTYIANGKSFSIGYGDGSGAKGIFSNDTVTISGISVQNQAFAECTDFHGMDDNPYDGILGLAYPKLAQGDEIPVFYNMWAQGLIPQPIFSFYLNPDVNDSNGGELILGNVDTSKYTGLVIYVSVVVPGYWEFQIDKISIGSTNITSSVYAMADTGSTAICGPENEIDAINQALGATYDWSSKMYTVDCINRPLSSFPDVIFTISGQALPLKPLQYLLIYPDDAKQYVCYTAFTIVNQQDSDGNDVWILGDYFLYWYYSIYDIVNNQVGFATSVSYNWTQEINPPLFCQPDVVENTTAAINSNVSSYNGGTVNICKLPSYLYSFTILSLLIFRRTCFFS